MANLVLIEKLFEDKCRPTTEFIRNVFSGLHNCFALNPVHIVAATHPRENHAITAFQRLGLATLQLINNFYVLNYKCGCDSIALANMPIFIQVYCKSIKVSSMTKIVTQDWQERAHLDTVLAKAIKHKGTIFLCPTPHTVNH